MNRSTAGPMDLHSQSGDWIRQEKELNEKENFSRETNSKPGTPIVEKNTASPARTPRQRMYGTPRSRMSINTPKKKIKKERVVSIFDPQKHVFVPYILSGYIQLTVNVFFLSCVVYAVVQFIRMVQRDVSLKVDEQLSALLAEISQCSKLYITNKCMPELRVPAMESSCREWEACMNRDPSVVGKAKVSAQTFAEIINSFVDQFSYKTMLFCALLVFGFIFVSNLAFGINKQRAAGTFRRDQPHSMSLVET